MKRGKVKRGLAVVLALIMILSLAGCGNKPTESTTAPEAGKTQEASEPTAKESGSASETAAEFSARCGSRIRNPHPYLTS